MKSTQMPSLASVEQDIATLSRELHALRSVRRVLKRKEREDYAAAKNQQLVRESQGGNDE